MVGTGVKAAYCNDAFLIISADGSPGFANTLSTVRNPPGSTDATGWIKVLSHTFIKLELIFRKLLLYQCASCFIDYLLYLLVSVRCTILSSFPSSYFQHKKLLILSYVLTTGACVTRTVQSGKLFTYKIPLSYTLLATADPGVNNVNTNSFPNGGGDNNAAYMLKSDRVGATYGLPTRGSVAVSIAGQDIYPAFNNNAYLAPQKCEVDSCNEHVGGGGGQPHLHGDPFGTFCLYSSLNYTSSTVHPPQIGWSLDGPSIYGRHLSTKNEGYSTPLDDCGGHVHTGYTYHYHAQVLTSTVDNGVAPTQKDQIGTTYYASTTGPYIVFY
jgi:hypothetical protein